MERLSHSKYYIQGGIFSAVVAILLIAIVSYLHISTPPGFTIVHIVHYYLLYLIIIFVAMKFGFLGGVISSVIITLLYAPTVYLNIFNLKHYHIRSLVEILMMYTLGIFAGVYSQRLYLKTCRLQDAFEKLKKYSQDKIKMEQEIAKSEKLRVMGQLSAGIAHEIKNPLASLRSAAKMLKDGKNLPQLLDIMISEIDRLNTFVERFLQYANFGKIEDQKISVTKLYLELKELLKLLVSPYKDINVAFNCKIEDEKFIKGDINNLKQAFLNIFSNAIEEISDIDYNKEIFFEAFYEENWVVFKIKDSGYGIKEDLIEKVFEPFFTTKETGTGLGLTITNKIIKEHGGILEIENQNGATFIIKLQLENYENSVS